ncbi:maleylpyruvate isomerase family mycothiol-dependent enzyme [Micromonospora sp. WMMD1082]|uniref:maleylpyruvate isomerase family mycothiol-dependent enzyme n=1 Tax=Micromonospora sp. WMMD1082 TaxID=3016104 RepID=UPI0024171D2D|nr:maleylpyruvate isomerase family mycothiol-dependent enzyme [Micromonospora sp. WMMD1082]MDG4797016.1 maleylpyruvate isomerase family mycothiol-dependent enzyme [Micromonospora sp. WMMD1082]
MESTPLPLAARDYLEPLAAEMAAFEAIARKADLSLPVRVSRHWQLRDLVGHLGGIHRWAAENIRTGKRARQVPKPDEDVAPADWYRAGADLLLRELAETDPHAPCWNFSTVPRTADFWFRRQLHETTIHGRDADQALGEVRPVPDLLAADGVDEVLRVMLAVGHRWDGKPVAALTGPVAVELPDTGHRWVLSPSDGRVPTVSGPAATAADDPVAVLRGPAEQVLLLLWQRLPIAAGKHLISGDADLVQRLLKSQITP